MLMHFKQKKTGFPALWRHRPQTYLLDGFCTTMTNRWLAADLRRTGANGLAKETADDADEDETIVVAGRRCVWLRLVVPDCRRRSRRRGWRGRRQRAFRCFAGTGGGWRGCGDGGGDDDLLALDASVASAAGSGGGGTLWRRR